MWKKQKANSQTLFNLRQEEDGGKALHVVSHFPFFRFKKSRGTIGDLSSSQETMLEVKF